MNREELIFIMKKFDITPISENYDYVSYKWQEFTISFRLGWQKVEVTSEDIIPKEVLERISTNYQGWQYNISFSQKERNQETDKLYLPNKECLLIFMLEMLDYQQEKQGLARTYATRYNEYLERINLELLTSIKPAISAEDWVKRLPWGQPSYQKALEQTNKNEVYQLLRTEILEFDKAINPFLDKMTEEDLVKMSPQDLLIRVYTNSFIPDCCTIEIRFAGNNLLSYERGHEGFRFKFISDNKDDFLEVEHYYNNLIGEKISFCYPETIDIAINKRIICCVSNGTIEEQEIKRPASTEDIKKISFMLAEATKRAKNLFGQALTPEEARISMINKYKMNRLEYKIVLDTIGLGDVSLRAEGTGQTEDVHSWPSYPLNIRYYEGFAIVSGKIPPELATILYYKYPGEKYGIRINGGRIDRDPQNEIVNYYHIDTKEGLLAFFTELKDYESRQKGLLETEVENYDKLLGIINEKLIKIVNLGVSPQNCVEGLEAGISTYKIALQNTKKSKIGLRLRNAIKNFDKAVNPFMDKRIELDSAENYLKNVTLKIYSSEIKNKKNVVDCQLAIKYGEDYGAAYVRDNEGFNYRFWYKNIYGKTVVICHSFFTSGHEEIGEQIDISYYDDTGSRDRHIFLNINTGKFRYSGINNSAKKDFSRELLIEVINELEKATSFAQCMIVDRMKKKEDLQLSLKRKKCSPKN